MPQSVQINTPRHHPPQAFLVLELELLLQLTATISKSFYSLQP